MKANLLTCSTYSSILGLYNVYTVEYIKWPVAV